jgi:DNA-binding IclR family transcriptional regulator
MTAEQSNAVDWLRLIQAEYLEMPGLHLTKSQIQRLWRLDPQTCDTLLDALVASEFLTKTPREAYVLSSAGR